MLYYWLGFVYGMCCVLSYGVIFGNMRTDPYNKGIGYRDDAGLAVLGSLAGPASLVVAYLMTGFAQHGLKFR